MGKKTNPKAMTLEEFGKQILATKMSPEEKAKGREVIRKQLLRK
ncbi:MAG TPA: hypothetical protein VMF66_09255 [Candidatus Acidoferrum sp.]|nr:hypothetical protein [Candidatus Acidoferrum sp.]